MSEPQLTSYSGWALVEQMGFRQTVGKVCEVEQYGTKMLRLDIPTPEYVPQGEFPEPWTPEAFTTRFLSGQSIYQVTPLSEAVALGMVKDQRDVRPVRPTDYRIEDKRRASNELNSTSDEPDLDEEHPF